MKKGLQHQKTAVGEIQPATLRFSSGWRNIQQGNIVAGRKLIIEYDPERLPNCRLKWHGAEMGDIEIYIKFHPGGQYYTESLKKEKSYAQELRTKRYEVDVPMDATKVELWFRNFYAVSSICEAWDSQFGRNYWFHVVRE